MSAEPLGGASPGFAPARPADSGQLALSWAPQGAARWPYLIIVLAYWFYVTLSNVLYASSMGTGLAAETSVQLFAPPAERVLQHVILLPALLLFYWWSLRLSWRPLGARIPLQALLGVGFGLLGSPALLLTGSLCGDPEIMAHHIAHMSGWMPASSLALWLASMTSFLLQYGFGLALLNAFRVYQYFRDSELRREKIEREWSAARLAALRMQLSPHTLFNLLHTIRGQISWDPRTAQSMIVQLADLLRRLLTAGEREFSRLHDEMHFVRLYLQLQQQRFSDRLSFRLPDDAQLAGVWVPSLITQPLVENAVAHGLAGHEGAVQIEIEAQREGGNLVLRIRNGVAAGHTVGAAGIGTKNVRERLIVHFGDAAQLRSGPVDAAGWLAELRMPALDLAPDGATPLQQRATRP